MPRLEPQRHVTSQEVVAALRLPDSFVSQDDRLGETWGIGPALTSRGFRIRSESTQRGS
jgi:hypothetical protein